MNLLVSTNVLVCVRSAWVPRSRCLILAGCCGLLVALLREEAMCYEMLRLL